MGECFWHVVKDQKSSALLQVLKDRVCLGTTIYSDCGRAYDCLETEGFQNLKVDCFLIFKHKDKDTGCNKTQLRECDTL
jgi:transposase-like protein